MSLRERIWDVTETNAVFNSCIMLVIAIGAINDMVETEVHVHASGPSDPASRAVVVIDTICVVIFTIEFVVRVACTPSLRAFAHTPMNWVDLIAIVPSYIGYIIDASMDEEDASSNGFLELSTTLHFLDPQGTYVCPRPCASRSRAPRP